MDLHVCFADIGVRMAAGSGVRPDDGLRPGVGPVRRVLAAAVQGSQVVGRHWLGVGLQEGRAGGGRPNAPAHVGVSVRLLFASVYKSL